MSVLKYTLQNKVANGNPAKCLFLLKMIFRPCYFYSFSTLCEWGGWVLKCGKFHTFFNPENSILGEGLVSEGHFPLSYFLVPNGLKINFRQWSFFMQAPPRLNTHSKVTKPCQGWNCTCRRQNFTCSGHHCACRGKIWHPRRQSLRVVLSFFQWWKYTFYKKS